MNSFIVQAILIAENLSKIGNEFRTIISDMYVQYANIGKEQIWTGKNYNTIAKNLFNNARDSFEDLSDFIQFKVPQELYLLIKNQDQDNVSEFHLYKASNDISPIEHTEEKIDGSFKIKTDVVKDIIQNVIVIQCNNANQKLQEYNRQFCELGSTLNDPKLIILYEKIDEIIDWSNRKLRSFVSEIETNIEITLREIQRVDEETTKLAKSNGHNS